MESEDRYTLRRAVEWGENGYRIYLASVGNTWGSAPRAPGAWMCVREDGHVAGSVSGGCIESDLIHLVTTKQLAHLPVSLKRYGITQAEASRFRLPCGGRLDLIIEALPSPPQLRLLLDAVNSKHTMVREVNIQSALCRLRTATASDKPGFDGDTMKTLHGPAYRLLLIGAGPLSAILANMAAAFDYDITVCDPREEFLAQWPIAGVSLCQDMPDEAVVALQADAHSAILALTHDPKLDDMALLEALKTPAFYIGALGSRRNSSVRRERLALFDLTPEQIKRLKCPVGLHLGGRTPAEIAVAVLADLIATRNDTPVLQRYEHIAARD